MTHPHAFNENRNHAHLLSFLKYYRILFESRQSTVIPNLSEHFNIERQL